MKIRTEKVKKKSNVILPLPQINFILMTLGFFQNWNLIDVIQNNFRIIFHIFIFSLNSELVVKFVGLNLIKNLKHYIIQIKLRIAFVELTAVCNINFETFNILIKAYNSKFFFINRSNKTDTAILI